MYASIDVGCGCMCEERIGMMCLGWMWVVGLGWADCGGVREGQRVVCRVSVNVTMWLWLIRGFRFGLVIVK